MSTALGLSSKNQISYRYGITGFVELHKDIVKKYSEFDQLYWLKEYSILIYLWPFRTDNIIKYQSGAITYKMDISTNIYKSYYECILERYPVTLYERRLYRDNEIIQLLLDITSALAFLHSKNISHRDIKPTNIALTDTNRAVLIDFSHSHKMDIPLLRLDPQVVTYWYRAPEVFMYQENKEIIYDSSIDIWALGMVMIEILTGKNFANHYTSLIKDNSVAEKMYGMMLQNSKVAFNNMKEYYFLKKRTFGYTAQYWEWIKKMIASEPERRITATELYEDVMAFAKLNNINFITPVNGIIDVVLPALENNSVNNNPELFDMCIGYIRMLRFEHSMLLDIHRINEVVKFMVQQNEITKDNYRIVCAALAIIIETVLFDGVTDFENYGSLNNKMVKDAIITLLHKYDQHLFGENKMFSYKTKIEDI